MEKEQLAEEYCAMKQRQSLGQFSDHELFIMRFAFMAGYDANKTKTLTTEDIEGAAHFEAINIHGKKPTEARVHFTVGFKHGVDWNNKLKGGN